MTDIRKTLDTLADAIEQIASTPAPEPIIKDRSLSGNKINGGIITNFASAGIKDNSTYKKIPVLSVEDFGIITSAIQTPLIKSSTKIEGNLDVDGEITAKKLHVDEITADIRHERTSPLEFKAEDGSAQGKGLLWTGGGYTKQFVLQKGDKLFSSEHLDLHRDREYKINNQTVLSQNALGPTVTKSNLKQVGILKDLNVTGDFVVDQYLFWDGNTQRLGLGTDQPNGDFSIGSLDHEFVIGATGNQNFKLGTWTTSGLEIITDDTVRLSIGPNGHITLYNKTVVEGSLGINVKNFSTDADITTAGPVRFQDKKFEVSQEIPISGQYKQGDVVWNANPIPSGYVGWVCVRDGTPGEWKPFGQIAS